MLDKETQEEQQVIKFYPKDEGLYISDFDNYMDRGNPFIKIVKEEYEAWK